MPGHSHNAKTITHVVTGFFILCLLLAATANEARAASKSKTDTLFIKKGTYFYMFGSVFKIQKDTFFVKDHRIIGSQEQSEVLYDSIYSKFSRKTLTRLLYDLAFRKPQKELVSDSNQVIKSESPFNEYKGKIIRSIKIVSLEPFGTSVSDTTDKPRTGAGRFLNNLHIRTYPYVIRKNLQIKKGMSIDPKVMAENERLIRDLPYIHDATTYITPADDPDSVDVTIVAQDVWSIGFDLITITPTALRMRLYDANFLGMGDRLSVNFSTDLKRGPFFLIDGASYVFGNVWGTFIDLRGSFSQDIHGNQSILLSAERSFYSNQVKWAGGVLAEYRKSVSEDIPPLKAYSDHESAWIGRAFPIKNDKRSTRIVLLESFGRIQYHSRPYVDIDSNRGYYNNTQFLTGVAWSRNNYYISDYMLDFGEVENIPYGSLFQLNFGPDLTDFYNRFYTGFCFSGGNYIRRFGYISAALSGGGFIYRDHLEDEVLKFTTFYMTPAINSQSLKYKFRSFFQTDFRVGTGLRKNNYDQFNINDNLDIDEYANDSIFKGTRSFTATLSSILFTPWYFYGFKFALVAQIQGGLVGVKEANLLKQPLFYGVGLGIMTKNNNLIFPSVIISLFYYTYTFPGVQRWQLRFDPEYNFGIPDFNPHVPGVESLQN